MGAILSKSLSAALQIPVGFAALAAMVLAPPSRGPVLIVPVSGSPRAAADFAAAHGMPILARGPVDGSLIVLSPARPWLWDAATSGLVLMSSSYVACGQGGA